MKRHHKKRNKRKKGVPQNIAVCSSKTHQPVILRNLFFEKLRCPLCGEIRSLNKTRNAPTGIKILNIGFLDFRDKMDEYELPEQRKNALFRRYD